MILRPLSAALLFSFLGAAPAVAQHPWGSTPCPPDQPSPSYGTDTSTSMQTELSDSVHISGGCIDNTLIGSKVPADATVHNLLVTGTSNIGGGGGSTPGGAVGSLQFNNSGILGGYTIGQSFSTAGGTFDLASGAFAFNVGNLGGDLSGLLPSPTLSVGAASRNVGALGGGLSGALPNPSLVPLAVQTALGPPSGDLGGPGWPNVLVTGLQGFPVASTPPTPNSTPTWNGSQYVPTVQAPGMNQLTGDVTAIGTGSQPTLISPGAVTNQKLANQQAGTVKCNSGAFAATPQDCPVNGGLTLASGALQLDPNIGTSQQLTVGTNCWTITHGIVSTIAAGACTTGTINLTADDGATLLTADDGATLLTADGAATLTPCATNLVLKENISTGCNLAAVAVAMR